MHAEAVMCVYVSACMRTCVCVCVHESPLDLCCDACFPVHQGHNCDAYVLHHFSRACSS